MQADWRRFCQTVKYEVVDNTIRVKLAGERYHRVRVTEDGDNWRLEAAVSRRGVKLSPQELKLFAWRRNRAVDLVGFRIDKRQRVLGEAWIPITGTKAPEFRLVLDAVARECDLLEFTLTGRDIE